MGNLCSKKESDPAVNIREQEDDNSSYSSDSDLDNMNCYYQSTLGITSDIDDGLGSLVKTVSDLPITFENFKSAHMITDIDKFYTKQNTLGEGNFGTVYKAVKKGCGTVLALKQIKKSSMIKSE